MAFEDIDPEEVDRLVKQLSARRRMQSPAPVAPPANAAAPSPEAIELSAPAPAATPGSRWATNRLLMPADHRAGGARKGLALASAITTMLPAWPRIALPALTESQWIAITARMFVGLGVVLGGAMPFWPYAHARAWGLVLYLVAVLLVIVTGVWGSKLTWDARLGRAHAVALATVVWGLALAALELLPRIGIGIG